MNKVIDKEWKLLEAKTESLLLSLRSFTDEQLNAKPAPGAWSPLQVVQHIMRAEDLSVKYMQKKLSFHQPIPKAGFKGAMRYQLFALLNRSGIKIKAPEALASFRENARMEDLKKSWTKQRADLYQDLSHLSDDLAQGELFKHPLVGKMNVSQMIAFFGLHLDRHRKQIERSMKK